MKISPQERNEILSKQDRINSLSEKIEQLEAAKQSLIEEINANVERGVSVAPLHTKRVKLVAEISSLKEGMRILAQTQNLER